MTKKCREARVDEVQKDAAHGEAENQ